MKKDLKLKDVASFLQVSDKTIYRWIKEGKIPFYRINHQYRFIHEDIVAWIKENNEGMGTKLKSVFPDEKQIDDFLSNNHNFVNLTDCVLKGGIHYRIEGETVTEFLKNAVNTINIPYEISREEIFTKLIQRENMASTSIGDGIAFPHPRVPVLPHHGTELAAICFPEDPITYENSIDDKPLHTFIIILSANQDRHLKTMSKLAFISKQKEFEILLKKQAKRTEIISYIVNSKI